MAATEIKKRRLPPILTREIEIAFQAVKPLGHKKTFELLAQYRRNRAKHIAAWGLTTPTSIPLDLESIPAEDLWRIAALHQAFEKMWFYKNGGQGDYAAADVASFINSGYAQKTRRRKTEYDEIFQYLYRRKYEASSNKKALIAEAAEHFDVSPSTVNRAWHKHK